MSRPRCPCTRSGSPWPGCRQRCRQPSGSRPRSPSAGSSSARGGAARAALRSLACRARGRRASTSRRASRRRFAPPEWGSPGNGSASAPDRTAPYRLSRASRRTVRAARRIEHAAHRRVSASPLRSGARCCSEPRARSAACTRARRPGMHPRPSDSEPDSSPRREHRPALRAAAST